MTIPNLPHYLSKSLACAFTAGLLVLSTSVLQAAPAQKTAGPKRTFATSDQAVKALRVAGEALDTATLREIFGPEYDEILTGDGVQDANNLKRFSEVLKKRCTPVKENDSKVILELGANHWPLPIPLVKANGEWFFDTAAGKEELINRHIGKDELHAIGVCRDYVAAQQQYALIHPENKDGSKYAKLLKSTPGKKDGLYWPVTGKELESPFGPLVAQAQSEGYVVHKGTGPHPFHGYCFRILTQQGKDAPGGKMSYIHNGDLTNGFALVAYPEHWDQSGIMTFIVNQDGRVYQKNLGPQTVRLATALREYNPGSEWELVKDTGLLRSVREK
jgi:hypothetical protein